MHNMGKTNSWSNAQAIARDEEAVGTTTSSTAKARELNQNGEDPAAFGSNGVLDVSPTKQT
jgi:hypothetical protein